MDAEAQGLLTARGALDLPAQARKDKARAGAVSTEALDLIPVGISRFSDNV